MVRERPVLRSVRGGGIGGLMQDWQMRFANSCSSHPDSRFVARVLAFVSDATRFRCTPTAHDRNSTIAIFLQQYSR